MHGSAMEIVETALDMFTDYNAPLDVLDVGSYDVNGSYKLICSHPNWNYIGLDIREGPNVDLIVKDGYNWTEVESKLFDITICGQVLEHVEYPWLLVKEMARVLKLGGLCIIVAPSYGNIKPHDYPMDCYRYLKLGMRALLKQAGLGVLTSGMSPIDSFAAGKKL